MAQRTRRGIGGRVARRARIQGSGMARARSLACVLVVVVAAAVGIGVSRVSAGGFSIEREGGTGAGEATAEQVEGASRDGGGTEAEAGAQGGAGQEPQAQDPSVVVHVDGAVARPGVYELEGEAPRVGDAVDAAGGLTAEADTTSVNLASRVADGEKVHIPAVGEEPSATAQAEAIATSAAGESQAGGTTGAGQTGSTGLVNINTASSEELQTLPGVGEVTAQAIIEDRERNGRFETKEDLMRVSGIGEKKFAKLEGSICV